MRRVMVVGLAATLLGGCYSTVNILKPGGDVARVVTRSGAHYDVELLAVTNESLVVMTAQKVLRAPLADISGVHVSDYSLRDKKILPMGLVGLAYAFSAYYGVLSGISSHSAPLALLVGLPLAGLAAVSILTIFWADPRVDFSPPFGSKDIANLRLYCRYPQDLTAEQWHELLIAAGQPEFERLH